jgi:hypothetical protein
VLARLNAVISRPQLGGTVAPAQRHAGHGLCDATTSLDPPNPARRAVHPLSQAYPSDCSCRAHRRHRRHQVPTKRLVDAPLVTTSDARQHSRISGTIMTRNQAPRGDMHKRRPRLIPVESVWSRWRQRPRKARGACPKHSLLQRFSTFHVEQRDGLQRRRGVKSSTWIRPAELERTQQTRRKLRLRPDAHVRRTSLSCTRITKGVRMSAQCAWRRHALQAARARS